MTRYTIDATFPMEDGTLGDITFTVEADNIQKAMEVATATTEAISDLDLTIWSVCESEQQ